MEIFSKWIASLLLASFNLYLLLSYLPGWKERLAIGMLLFAFWRGVHVDGR